MRNPYKEFDYAFLKIKEGLKSWLWLLFKHPKCIFLGHDWESVNMSEHTQWIECKRCRCMD